MGDEHLRPLSLTVVNKLMKRLDSDNEFDLNIHKIRVNCWIDASRNVRERIGGKIYSIGNCDVYVSNSDIVTDIRWDELHRTVSKDELSRLMYFYRFRGLSIDGSTYEDRVHTKTGKNKRRKK